MDPRLTEVGASYGGALPPNWPNLTGAAVILEETDLIWYDTSDVTDSGLVASSGDQGHMDEIYSH